MKSKLALILLMMITTYSYASNIEGRYYCKGHDPYRNIDYPAGEMFIKKTGDTYTFTFKNDANSDNEVGTGVLDKESGILSVVYNDPKGPNPIGVQSYKIIDDGRKLQGPWANLGKTKVGIETCEKKVPHSF